MMSPEDSWVSKWQRVSEYLPFSLSWPSCVVAIQWRRGLRREDGIVEKIREVSGFCHLLFVARSDSSSLRIVAFLSSLA